MSSMSRDVNTMLLLHSMHTKFPERDWPYRHPRTMRTESETDRNFSILPLGFRCSNAMKRTNLGEPLSCGVVIAPWSRTAQPCL